MTRFSFAAAKIRRRLKQLNVLRMVRLDSNATPVNAKMKQLELNPDFIKECDQKQYPKMMSLGDYLSSLCPNLTKEQQLPDWLDTAVQNAITRVLLKRLGDRKSVV